MSLNLPTKYSRIPIPPPPGSLGGTLSGYVDGVQTNLSNIATTVNQAIQCLADLDKADAALTARIKALEVITKGQSAAIAELQADVGTIEVDVGRLNSLNHDYLLLTAAPGGSTWDLSAQVGYPYLRAVIIDPNGETNTLTLPALGSGDKAIFTIKCLANSGNVIIDAGAANIVSSQGPGASVYGIPFALLTPDVTVSTYGVTIIWTGSVWHIIDTSILVV